MTSSIVLQDLLLSLRFVAALSASMDYHGGRILLEVCYPRSFWLDCGFLLRVTPSVHIGPRYLFHMDPVHSNPGYFAVES